MKTESEILENGFFKVRGKKEQITTNYYRIILSNDNRFNVIKMNEDKERLYNQGRFLNSRRYSSEREAREYMNKLKYFAEELKTNNMKSAIHFFVSGIERIITKIEKNPNISTEDILQDLKKMVGGIKA